MLMKPRMFGDDYHHRHLVFLMEMDDIDFLQRKTEPINQNLVTIFELPVGSDLPRLNF